MTVREEMGEATSGAVSSVIFEVLSS
jgi:hypothetical protein